MSVGKTQACFFDMLHIWNKRTWPLNLAWFKNLGGFYHTKPSSRACDTNLKVGEPRLRT